MTTPKPVPSFAIGETGKPMEYLRTAIPAFCGRIGMSTLDQTRFVEAALASVESTIPLMSPERLITGMVEPTPQARAFWNLTGDMLLDPESELVGTENLNTALHYVKEGWNMVLVQNHRSGADMLVMETLIRRVLGKDICADWAYMAGHAVNLFLIPLMFSAALRRFQIFSVKYQSTTIPGIGLTEMKQQNHRAMTALSDHVRGGTKTLVYYPEGGRGTGEMKKGEPRTSCIPRNIATCGKKNGKPLLILPTYVDGTECLLPQSRGNNEFNEVFELMQRGKASLRIGQPICWDAILEANQGHEGQKFVWNQRICDTLLTLVARLGPENERGVYGNRWDLITPLVNEGATQ